MTPIEIRDPRAAQRGLLQSLWLARSIEPSAPAWQDALRWAFEIAAAGEAIPPLALVLDVGRIVLGGTEIGGRHPPPLPRLEPSLTRRYEDYVLGRLYSNGDFQRAADAVAACQGERQTRGLAFLLQQMRVRANLPGVSLNPAVIKGLLRQQPTEQLLAESWASIEQEGWDPFTIEQYEQATAAMRNAADLLSPADVRELEHGLAVEDFSQRLALRQLWEGAELLAAELPQRRLSPRASRREATTKMTMEDLYPTGGFAAITNRGGIENLLHSQLAYMEENERPDLFDVKYLRDELLYYARDENQFRRERRTHFFVLSWELAETRVKDDGAPAQRLILLLAMIQAAIDKLSDWLSQEALRFEILLLTTAGQTPLKEERRLLEIAFRDEIAAHRVVIEALSLAELEDRCRLRAQRSHCFAGVFTLRPLEVSLDGCDAVRVLCGAEPELLVDPDEPPLTVREKEALDRWRVVLFRLLEHWS